MIQSVLFLLDILWHATNPRTQAKGPYLLSYTQPTSIQDISTQCHKASNRTNNQLSKSKI